MRTLLLSLLLIVTTGIYSKNVVITGQAPADLNGREVFLLKWDWDADGYQRVDSMKIKNGKFCFNTEINIGILGKIECPVSGHKYEIELFINHDTVSGFILELLGEIPEDNQERSVTINNLIFKITGIKANRVTKIKLTIKEEPEANLED